jgi:hypothetical protein
MRFFAKAKIPAPETQAAAAQRTAVLRSSRLLSFV